MTSVLKRFGTEGALNWIRLRSRAATKRKNQGCGFAPTEADAKDEEPVSDGETAQDRQNSSIEFAVADEASMMALQDFVVCRSGPLPDSELKQVWSVLQRRKQRSNQTDSLTAGSFVSELQSDWISDREEMDVPEHDDISLLIRFMKTNKTLQKFPAISLQWLAARLQPQEISLEVEAPAAPAASPRSAASSWKLAAFRSLTPRDLSPLDVSPEGSPRPSLSPSLPSTPRKSPPCTSFSAKVLQQARELGEVSAESKVQSGSASLGSLDLFIRGEAQWKGCNRNLLPGDLMIDLSSFMPSWYSWKPQTKKPQLSSSILVATVELDQEFVDKFGAPFQCAAERAAAFHSTAKLGTRSISDVSMIVRYLQRMEAFTSLTPETLEAIACALQARSVQQNEVLCSEGDLCSELFLPLSTVVTAWRPLPELSAGEKRLSSDAVEGAKTALAQLQGTGRKNEKKKDLQWLQTCVDIVLRDKVVPHSEWALAGGKKCSVSLVAHRAGKGFSLSKSDYERHLQQHRSERAPLEVATFLAKNLSPHLSHRDHLWLEETPLARCQTLRVLPQKVRLQILSKGRLQRLPAHSWLCQEDDILESGLMVVRGQMEFSPHADDERNTTLLPCGSVIGEFVFCSSQLERGVLFLFTCLFAHTAYDFGLRTFCVGLVQALRGPKSPEELKHAHETIAQQNDTA